MAGLELAPEGWFPGKIRRARLHLFSSVRLEGEGPPLQISCFDAGDPVRARRWLVRAFRFGRSEPGLLGRFGVQALREEGGTEALGVALESMALVVRADARGAPLLRGYVMDLLRTNQAEVGASSPRPGGSRLAERSPESPRKIHIPLDSYQGWTPANDVLPGPGEESVTSPRGDRPLATRSPNPPPSPTRRSPSTPRPPAPVTRRPSLPTLRPTPLPTRAVAPTRSPPTSRPPPVTRRPSLPTPIATRETLPTRSPTRPTRRPIPVARPTRSPSPVPPPPTRLTSIPATPTPVGSVPPTRRAPPPTQEVEPTPRGARILLDQGRRLEARGRIDEAVGQYRRAAALGNSAASQRLLELARDFPSLFGHGATAAPTVPPATRAPPLPTRPVTRPVTPTQRPVVPPTRLPEPPTPTPTVPNRPVPPPSATGTPDPGSSRDELVLLRRDALLALAAGEERRAHELLVRAGRLGDGTAAEEARRLEQRYPELAGSGVPSGAGEEALARARAAESRGELRAAYSEYMRAIELGSDSASRDLRALERGLHRRHFELTERYWSGEDPVARRQLEELVRRFPEVFREGDLPEAPEAEAGGSWIRGLLALLCVVGAAFLLVRGRSAGRGR